MKAGFSKLVRLIAVASAFGGAAFAHHSAAMFDRDKTVTLKGAVREFRFTNPHSWIYLLIPTDGKDVEWPLEGGSISILVRSGYTANSVKPGDHISVTIHPRVDGAPGGSFQSVTTADGKTLSMNPLF